MYPNVFYYLGYLREDVGLYNVFTVGLPASIIGSAIKSWVCEYYLQKNVIGYFYKKSVIETQKGWKVFFQETCKLTAGRCLGLIASYPLQVIMIRQIAQHVGKETLYNSILKAFVEINVNEGLPGLFRQVLLHSQVQHRKTQVHTLGNITSNACDVSLFLSAFSSGLIPRLLGEIITVWLTAGLAYALDTYIFTEDIDYKIREQSPYVASVSTLLA
ncbi:unnamed protein product [Mesocestoides corti]|uniref:Solute carrier family 25 member 46 n=1 Tax=Mesocestoides corti TaxID=53468 RepID=A0A0R3U6R9_MESCO|nr:unnamed protein product [Mesocestoides corti]